MCLEINQEAKEVELCDTQNMDSDEVREKPECMKEKSDTNV